MKLLMTQSNLTLRGGAERILLKIAQRYDATIYTAEYNKDTTFGEFEELDVNVMPKSAFSKVLPYGRVLQGLNYGLGFYNLKISDDYDVINAHMAPSHWVRHNNPRVLWYCHTPLRDVWDLYEYRLKLKKWHQKPVHVAGAAVVRRIDRFVVKDIEMIYANSDNTRSRVVRYFGRGDAKTLPGGIDIERFGNDGDDRFFYYPSRISPNKQQHIVIEAFGRFRRLYKGRKGYKLVLAGSVSKDKFFWDYYQKVKEMAARVPGVEILTDVLDDQWLDLYKRCTAVLYSPINEDYGLVPLEAMASRKPIIALNEGGPRETIVDGKTGFLVNDPKGMAERMLYVVDYPAHAKRLGENGLRRVKAHYSWNRFFEEFDRGLRKVAKAEVEGELQGGIRLP